ncbi:hypothetical protein SDC9_138089 [bioreactor metagenome]|uniref:Uncharacterized protein n=1 Tax=bioreactor metagenome TaxID=1076179 RepID=A0A645DNV0_9ZZZZ
MMIHLNGNWGINMVGVREVDVSWRQQKPEYNLKEGKQPILTSPFRLYEDPVVGKRKPDKTTSRPSYNVSFRELGGIKFLDFSSMINDITGYEWMPDNDIEKTAERGIKILMRGLEAKALAVLFTHEADYIYEIKPENWDTIMKKVSEGITVYNPINLTTDEALKILRAFNTSEIQECAYDIKTGELSVKMSGETDIQTSVFVYTDDGGTVNEKLVEIPVFQNSVKQIVQLFE